MDWDSINRNRLNAIQLDQLTEEEGGLLVKIAIDCVRKYILDGTKVNTGICGEKFMKFAGVFVTLKSRSQLRGCIGYPYPVFTLCEGLINASIAAATEDPRFTPVTAEELDEIEVEVTVLGFPEEVDQLSDKFENTLVIGRHGLIVSRGIFSGLLLPQVAVEESFTKREFLSATCTKAGLSSSAWEDRETKVYMFEGRVFP